METKDVTVHYDKDKIEALDVFLKIKDSFIEVEVSKQIDALYNKNVPSTVRDFISRKAEINAEREEE